MRVKLQLGDDDLRRFWAHALERQGMAASRSRLALTWLILLPLVALVPYLFTEVRTDGELPWTMILLMAFGGHVIFSFERQRAGQFARWMQSDDTRSMLQPTTMTFDADGITSESQRMRSWYAWSVVSDVVHAEDRMYIWLGAARCFILPGRAFRSSDERSALLASIERHRAKAASEVLHCPSCGYDLRGDALAGCPECGWGREGATAS